MPKSEAFSQVGVVLEQYGAGLSGLSIERAALRSRLIVNQVFIISKLDKLSERLPDVVGYLLFNLKSAARIDSDPLQVADHNVDDQITRQIFGGIFGKGYGRRGGYNPLARPEIHKRGISAPLHIRLLDEDQAVRIYPFRFQKAAAEDHVLAGVCRFRLDQHRALVYAPPQSDLGEKLRLGPLETLPRQRPGVARKHEQRRPTL